MFLPLFAASHLNNKKIYIRNIFAPATIQVKKNRRSYQTISNVICVYSPHFFIMLSFQNK